MKKQINIEGMSCAHCVKHVENALMEIEGTNKVIVDLKGNNAVIDLINNVSDEQLKEVIQEAGYDVTSIVNL
ncbi:MAG: heavy metal transport/detoxification protein [Firmicutes bacterium HGW-Firmicutes-7]|nr:MAG: heavy metal transport/detoxification protein [Firmicutes bacterium HGW-Firmicutes-7]